MGALGTIVSKYVGLLLAIHVLRVVKLLVLEVTRASEMSPSIGAGRLPAASCFVTCWPNCDINFQKTTKLDSTQGPIFLPFRLLLVLSMFFVNFVARLVYFVLTYTTKWARCSQVPSSVCEPHLYDHAGPTTSAKSQSGSRSQEHRPEGIVVLLFGAYTMLSMDDKHLGEGRLQGNRAMVDGFVLRAEVNSSSKSILA